MPGSSRSTRSQGSKDDDSRKLRSRGSRGRINFADLELSESDEEMSASRREEAQESGKLLTTILKSECSIILSTEVAIQLGLPADSLSWREKQELPEIAAHDVSHYVSVRNAILHKWSKNNKEYLTKAEATADLKVS